MNGVAFGYSCSLTVFSFLLQEVRVAFVTLVSTALRTTRAAEVPRVLSYMSAHPTPIAAAAGATTASDTSDAMDTSNGTTVAAAPAPTPAVVSVVVPMEDSPPVLILLLEALRELLKDAHMHWRNFAQFFAVFEEIALLGMVERQLLVSRGYLLALVNFFLGEEVCLKKYIDIKYL